MVTLLENILFSEKKLLSLKQELKVLMDKISAQKKLCAERDEICSSAEKIQSKLSELKKQVNESVEAMKELNIYIQDYQNKYDTWTKNGLLLFRKAAVANVRIVFHPDGYEMVSNTKNPGLYTRSERKGYYTCKISGNSKIMADLKNLAEKTFPYWSSFLESNKNFWNIADSMANQKKLGRHSRWQSLYEYLDEQEYIARKKRLQYDELVLTKNGFDLSQYRNVDEILHKLEFEKLNLDKKIETFKTEIFSLKEKMAKEDPVLAGFTISEDVTSGLYDDEWISIVKRAATVRKALPILPAGEFGYYKWLDEKPANLFVSPISGFKNLEMLVTVLMLAFPVPSVHFTIVGKDKITQFFKDLDNKVCTIIYEDHEISQYLGLLNKMFNESPDVNNQSIIGIQPKEVVVLTGYDNNAYGYTLNSIKNILRRGKEVGIYFVALPSEDYEPQKDPFADYFRDSSFCASYILDEPALVEVLDDSATVGQNVVMKKEKRTLGNLVVSYVNQCCVHPNNTLYEDIASGKLYQTRPIKDLLTEQSYNVANQIVVPFATSLDGTVMDLHFATADHFSTFVIGKSGSGKSYLLHSILTNMLLKYDSSIVDLILMDFKMGGVELNYYKDVPHVSKLLVNGSDKQIVCEIMTSLEDEMLRRGEDLNRCGVNNIDEYNDYARSHGLPLMRHVILLVDECQGLFKIDMNKRNSREEIQGIVEDIARQGRNQGVHLVFATQVFHSSGIPQAAIKQFTDFLFMECTSVDVADCDIENSEVKKAVEKLHKGEVVHYSHGSYTKGYVFDYAGEDGRFKKKTREVLCDKKRYTQMGEQFYFNASQLYYLGNKELQRVDKRLNRSVVPVAVLGCNLSVQSDPLMIRFSNEEGGNLLIMGYNKELQAERVLWNAVLSLAYSHHAVGRNARFKVFCTFREDEDSDKYLEEFISNRYNLLHKMDSLNCFELIHDEDRNRAIQDVGTIVRRRMNGEQKADTVYLVLPNHELYRKNLSRRLQNVEKYAGCKQTQIQSDDLGFEMPSGFGPAGKTAPAFQTIERHANVFAEQFRDIEFRPSSESLNDELKFILTNGPEQHVHVIMQVVAPDKVFVGDSGALRRTEMEKLFNNIVMLRMAGTVAEGLPVQSSIVEKLEMEVQRMRAILWNEENTVRTFVPYDFPGGRDDQSKGEILNKIINKIK